MNEPLVLQHEDYFLDYLQPGEVKGFYIPQVDSLRCACEENFPKPTRPNQEWFLPEIYCAMWAKSALAPMTQQVGPRMLYLMRQLLGQPLEDQDILFIKIAEMLGTIVKYHGNDAKVQSLIKNKKNWVLKLHVPSHNRTVASVGTLKKLLSRVE